MSWMSCHTSLTPPSLFVGRFFPCSLSARFVLKVRVEIWEEGETEEHDGGKLWKRGVSRARVGMAEA
ncbi:hypothetical protein M413DRAFT_442318 [Hebeloma cylindrosporum]|uniref:Uncharacterized protein n=1 Tax=Hebeloma cylindrosporum TaxID=76867 RepID=A0A0C3CA42_HEBCY|nr:hypothetical protein M413DRAFT_442318 [Hebeloma cylindrosporum h7]